ncbi:VOC family protein [Pseudonocardia adelaidensis]|uniref:VOC family protein n=1 Tax=Pseudonocardia adelaidensis TaxID=648754 RepID=A0ABP9NQA9_9PSEU
MTNTTAPAPNTVTWFQIGTEDPAAAREFYGGLFGWNVVPDPASPGYDLVSYAGGGGPAGGIARTDGGATNHATFLVLVEDAAAVCADAERLGGKVLVPPVTTPNGLVFAHLLDRSGNRFGVFTPPAA